MLLFGKKLEAASELLWLKSTAAVPTSLKTTPPIPIVVTLGAQHSTLTTAPIHTLHLTAILCGQEHSRSMDLASPSCSFNAADSPNQKASHIGGLFSSWGKSFRGSKTWEVWLVKHPLPSLNILYQLPLLPVLLPPFRPSASNKKPKTPPNTLDLTPPPSIEAVSEWASARMVHYSSSLMQRAEIPKSAG